MTLFGDKIFTRRLQLRRVEERHLGLLLQWWQSQVASGEYLTPEYYDPKQALEQIRAGVFWTEHDKLFLIELRDGPAIGTIRYWLRKERPEVAVVAVKIALPWERNKGYGTEAQKYLTMFLFDRVGVKFVEMYTDINNKPQQRCLGKLGFEVVDSLVYEDQHVQRTGYLYRLSRERYQQEPLYKYHYE